MKVYSLEKKRLAEGLSFEGGKCCEKKVLLELKEKVQIT